MIVKWYLLSVVLILTLGAKRIKSDESVVTINTKRSLHIVSEQFISISVDPALLLSNLNISTKSLHLASALSPAFIRITGASTNLIRWLDEKVETTSKSNLPPNKYAIDRQQWIGLNEWILNANLTPIFALNGHIRINNTIWDPRESLAIMTLTDRLNYSCFWELGYDCNTTLAQYVSDITSLQHIMDAFPTSKEYWGIIGSDISGCLAEDTFETIKNFFLSVEDSLDAINWHAKMVEDELFFTEKDPIIRALSPLAKTKLPVMVTVPRSGKGTTFADGLTWAIQMGDAAKYGFGVIFRQPRIREFFQETPAFWISLIHKHLMGRNVLDIRTTVGNRTHNHVYAHCTRKQNSYIRRGAMTLFGINTQEDILDIDVKFMGTQVKSAEVQSYILTSNGDVYDNEIFLNGEKMIPETFMKNGKLEISPKIRRARANRFITLSLPANSIGFFVFPGVRLPACVLGEDETDLIVEEIKEDQNIQLSLLNDKYGTEDEMISKSLSDDLKTFTLQNEILRQMISKKDMDESDERYNIEHGFKTVKKPSENRVEDRSTQTNADNHNTNEVRQHFIDHVRMIDRRRKIHDAEHNRLELRHKLQERIKSEKNKQKIDLKNKDMYDIELTSDEIKKILTERTKTQPNVSIDTKHVIAKKNGKKFESGEESETDRPKRFLPIDILKNFAEKNSENAKANKTDTDAKSRRKRQIDFGMTNRKRTRGGDILRNRKRINENDEEEEEFYFGTPGKFFLDQPMMSREKKKPEHFPQGDVYLDVKTDSSMEKNENYDYIDSDEGLSVEDMIGDHQFKHRDEDIDIRMPISYAQMDGANQRRKTIRDRMQKNREMPKSGWNSRGRADNVGNDGTDLATQLATQPNAWLQFDANDKYYHAPNEFYENFQKNPVNIRDDLRIYGELWEIDNMKEASDHDHSDGLIKDSHEDSAERARTQKLLDDYMKDLRGSSEVIKDGPVHIFDKEESPEKSEVEENYSLTDSYSYEEPKIILKRSNIPENEPNGVETNMLNNDDVKTKIEEKDGLEPKKRRRKSRTSTTTIQPTEAESMREEEPTTPKPRRNKQKIIHDKTEQVSHGRSKREIRFKDSNDIDVSSLVSLETISESNSKYSRKRSKNMEGNEIRMKRETDMYYDDDGYHTKGFGNRKRRDDLHKEQLKDFKNSIKQKHEIERRIRKADHQEEKRILKQLKSRQRRNVDYIREVLNEPLNLKDILYHAGDYSETLKETNMVSDVENELKKYDFEEDNVIFNEEHLTTESPQNVFTVMDDETFTTESYGPLRYTIGKPLDQIKLKPLNEKRITSFQKYLKTRLARQRKRFEKVKPTPKIKNNSTAENVMNAEVETMTPEEDIQITTEMPQRTNEIIKMSDRLSRSIVSGPQLLSKRVPRTIGSDDKINALDGEKKRLTRIPVVRNLIQKQLDEYFSRNRRSTDIEDDFYPHSTENEIFDDIENDKDLFFDPSKKTKYGNKLYKIPTLDGKKVVSLDDLINERNHDDVFIINEIVPLSVPDNSIPHNIIIDERQDEGNGNIITNEIREGFTVQDVEEKLKSHLGSHEVIFDVDVQNENKPEMIYILNDEVPMKSINDIFGFSSGDIPRENVVISFDFGVDGDENPEGYEITKFFIGPNHHNERDVRLYPTDVLDDHEFERKTVLAEDSAETRNEDNMNANEEDTSSVERNEMNVSRSPNILHAFFDTISDMFKRIHQRVFRYFNMF